MKWYSKSINTYDWLKNWEVTKGESSCCSGPCDSRGALIFGWSSVVESSFNSYNMKLKQVKIQHLILHLSLQIHSFDHYRHHRLCPIDIISWIKILYTRIWTPIDVTFGDRLLTSCSYGREDVIFWKSEVYELKRRWDYMHSDYAQSELSESIWCW